MEISMLFVHPTTPRKGIGTALLRHVFAVARARVWRVQVWTETDNPQAQQFYPSLGMTRPADASRKPAQPESADER
jgi:GNAT superfamily N-acetyltransferase